MLSQQGDALSPRSALARLEAGDGLSALVERIAERKIDPYSAAEEILAELMGEY